MKLYKRAAEVLLKRWQVHRAGRANVLEALGLGDRELYEALRELAYLAHSTGKGKEAADITRSQAFTILERHFAALEKPWEKAGAFLEYVDQTAGLLVGRGGVDTFVYAFPHRTFQEYFAGAFLAKSRQGFENELLEKLAEGDYWQLAAQLGLEDLLHNAEMPRLAENAAYGLCPIEPIAPDDATKWRGVLWSANFALEIGHERIKTDKVAGGGQPYLDRLIRNLVALIERGLLSATERVEAGRALSELGDPRPGVCDFDPAMWVPLNGGKFIMGDDKEGPPHDVELSRFKISQYPITNAQFEKFVQAGGYEDNRWWSKEGKKWRDQEKWRAPRFWEDKRWNLANHPVVGVSWFEAEAFCAWLSAPLAGGKKEIVRLPTEAEWEFTARGSAGRQYPWGDPAPTIEHANYGEVINRTTAVGSFPQGATSEGILDLAGNVWEWCLDWYDEKYYAECKKRGIVKDPCYFEKSTYRVLRGGAYWNKANDLRGAYRDGDDPNNRLFRRGFRVVLAAES